MFGLDDMHRPSRFRDASRTSEKYNTLSRKSLSDRSIVSQITGKVVILLSGSITAKLLQFIYFFSIVKLLDPHTFGQYVVSLTLCMIALFPVIEFGTELLITKEVVRGNITYYFNVLYWKCAILPVGVLWILLIGICFFYIPPGVLVLSALLIFSRSLENGNAAYLRGKNLSHIESRHLILSRAFSLLLLFATTRLAEIELTIHLAVIFQITGILLSIILIEKKYLFINTLPRFAFKEFKSVLVSGFPLLVNSVAWLLYFKIDVLLIGGLINNTAAGTYEIAYKILETFLIVPAAIMAIVLRMLTKTESTTIYRQIFMIVSVLMALAGILVAVSSSLILPYLFSFGFDNTQSGAIEIYTILAFSIPIIYVAHLTTQVLVIQNDRYRLLGITLIGAFVNLILNLLLIQIYGENGAALATVATELMILVLSSYYAIKRFGSHIVRTKEKEELYAGRV